MKNRVSFISLAIVLALGMGLVGCGDGGVPDTTEYSLTISSTEGGSVITPGEGTGSFTYDEGEVVGVVAEHDEGYQFAGWIDDVGTIADVNDETTTITMNGDYFITANFEPKPWDYTIELRLHCTISQVAPIVEYVYAPWIAELETLTGSQGGKFSINVTYGDTPIDGTTSLSAISAGVVDIGMLSPDNFHLGGIGSLPWFFPDMESAAYTTYYLFTEGNQKWDRGELGGVKILIASSLWGMQWWGNVDVRAPEDLAGLNIRAERGQAATIMALGATPVDIGTSYPDPGAALNEGIIDGCFFTYRGWAWFSGIGHNTQYTTELNMSFWPFALAMNKAVYDSLPAEARVALDSVCTAAKSVELAAANSAAMAEDRALTEGPNQFGTGRPIYVPTTDELDAWKAATVNVASDWAAYMTDPLGFDGEGILARAQELIAEYQSSTP